VKPDDAPETPDDDPVDRQPGDTPSRLDRLRRQAARSIIALSISTVGAVLFVYIGVPLPWTLGAMFASAVSAIWFNRWPMPAPIRNLARPVVGLLAGAAFTPEVVSRMLDWWPGVVSIACYSLVMGALGYCVFRSVFRLDPATAYFSSMPGGLGELSLLGDAYGGSMRTIVLMHSIRVVLTVSTIPFLIQFIVGHEIVRPDLDQAAAGAELSDWTVLALTGVAGYVLGSHFKVPGGIMVVTMICSALVHGTGLTHATPPYWLVAFVQVLIGSVAGARFTGLRWHELRRTILIAIGWASALLAGAGFGAWLGARLFDIPATSLLLALSPGGTSEMIIITYALGAEVAFVAVCQVSRIFIVLAVAPLLFQVLAGRPPP
jgi:membrane AbrB-like protein